MLAAVLALALVLYHQQPDCRVSVEPASPEIAVIHGVSLVVFNQITARLTCPY